MSADAAHDDMATGVAALREGRSTSYRTTLLAEPIVAAGQANAAGHA